MKVSLRLWGQLGRRVGSYPNDKECFCSFGTPLCKVVLSSEFCYIFFFAFSLSLFFLFVVTILVIILVALFVFAVLFVLDLSNLGLDNERWVELDENVDFSPRFSFFAFFALLVRGFKHLGMMQGGLSRDARIFFLICLWGAMVHGFHVSVIVSVGQ